MLKNIFSAALILLGSFVLVNGQTPEAAVKPSVVSGDAATVSDKKIVVSAKSGLVEVLITDKTVFKRVSAEKPSFQTATAGILTDIGSGDKLTVTGILSADGKSIPARTVYFITKSDIEKKNSKESEEWRTRGVAGKVAAVNLQTNQITVEISGLTGTTTITLTPKDKAKFLRYAPGSIRFDEAKDSSLGEIQVGDSLRALGDKSADGNGFAAEQVLTGAFQTIAGTVKSVDVEKNQVVIKDLRTNKDVTVLMGVSSRLKKFPSEMAERMAGMQMAGGVRPVGQRAAGQTGGQGTGTGRGGFGGGRAAGGIDDMFERFPDIKVADLKAGDMIAISSTKIGTATDRVTAHKLLAGVEPFLRMVQAADGQRGGQGVQGGFSIPGLDGIGFP